MKKINSILAIAAVALTSVVGFTSCDKNDDALSNQAPVVKGTADNSNTSSKSDLVYVKGSDGNKILDTSKKIDNSYLVGEWTATVNGTVYTLVVTNSSAETKYDIAYKATLKVGDQVYDGEYSASFIKYSGGFDSAERTAEGELKAQLQCATFSENNLNEFTADICFAGNESVNDVKFVKK